MVVCMMRVGCVSDVCKVLQLNCILFFDLFCVRFVFDLCVAWCCVYNVCMVVV